MAGTGGVTHASRAPSDRGGYSRDFDRRLPVILKDDERHPLDTTSYLNWYLNGEHEHLARQFLHGLRFYRDHVLRRLSSPRRHSLNAFVNTFLYLFTQPQFRLPRRYAADFIALNRTIANVVAISHLRSTDSYLDLYWDQPPDAIKAMTLYSARNTIRLDRTALFEAEPYLACLWYSAYASMAATGLASRTVVENLQEHFRFTHPRLQIISDLEEVFFSATYVDGQSDRKLKQEVNRAVRDYVAAVPPIENRPCPGKIAVASAVWSPRHPVWRNYRAYVAALREKYHLTLLQLGKNAAADTSLFDEVRVVDWPDDLSQVAVQLHNDFQLLYYPDVGMSDLSILMSNLRIAPVQICSPGHSVSTFGSRIDYFISGADVEPPTVPERAYSERLVLLPGMGVIHQPHSYQPKGRSSQATELIINGPWTLPKVNHAFLVILRRILERARRPIKLRVFSAGSSYIDNGHIPFNRELIRLLGRDRVELVDGLSPDEYLAAMEQGDLTIDSHHFGSCNAIADSLFLRIPTVTWEGDRWYNRIGPQMLRLAGMEECIARTEQEYVALVDRLIHDDVYRYDLRRRLDAANLGATIFSGASAKYFRDAVDYLIANHADLRQQGDRTPIRIPR